MVSIALLGAINTFSLIRSQFLADGNLLPSQDSTDSRRLMIALEKSVNLAPFV